MSSITLCFYNSLDVMTFEDLINGTLHILIQQPREEGRKTGALLDVRNGPIVNYQS